MLLTLDNDLAQLVTDLKWEDAAYCYTIAVVIDAERTVLSAAVVEEPEIELLHRLDGVRADHWSIADLFMDLLCGVAYGFSMAQPTGSHRYVLAMLATIRRHVNGT
jgi:hypothetical protein